MGEKKERLLYFSRLVPTGTLTTRSWIRQFLPFLANPLFIVRLAWYGSFINPSLRPLSGFIGADKAAILQAFPESIRGWMLVFDQATIPSADAIAYPCYIKPKSGERSVYVYKVSSQDEFNRLVSSGLFKHGSWIAQEAFSGTEFGINVVRRPNDGVLEIAFLTEKQTPEGVATASIANGAVFREMLDLIKHEQLKRFMFVLDRYMNMSPFLQDIHAGRFDVKAADLDSLLDGRFKLIELNGIGGMPLVYFDESPYPKWNAYFLMLLAIGKKNIRRFSYTKRLGRLLTDVPRVIGLILNQKHFRQYLHLPERY